MEGVHPPAFPSHVFTAQRAMSRRSRTLSHCPRAPSVCPAFVLCPSALLPLTPYLKLRVHSFPFFVSQSRLPPSLPLRLLSLPPSLPLGLLTLSALVLARLADLAAAGLPFTDARSFCRLGARLGSQIWRVVTSALFAGMLSFQFLMHLFMMYTYSRQLEHEQFIGRTADYIVFVAFSVVSLAVHTRNPGAPVLRSRWPFPLPSCAYSRASRPSPHQAVGLLRRTELLSYQLTMVIIYLWSQLNKDRIVTFYFGTRFQVRRFGHYRRPGPAQASSFSCPALVPLSFLFVLLTLATPRRRCVAGAVPAVRHGRVPSPDWRHARAVHHGHRRRPPLLPARVRPADAPQRRALAPGAPLPVRITAETGLRPVHAPADASFLTAIAARSTRPSLASARQPPVVPQHVRPGRLWSGAHAAADDGPGPGAAAHRHGVVPVARRPASRRCRQLVSLVRHHSQSAAPPGMAPF